LLPRSCDRIKRSATAGTIAAAKGMALAPTTAPPINPPSAFADPAAQKVRPSAEPEIRWPVVGVHQADRDRQIGQFLLGEHGLTLQLPICFKVRALSGGLVSSAPE
jgi:hypothetical protein